MECSETGAAGPAREARGVNRPPIPDAIIDGAMNQGGPSCAVATVKLLTDAPIDHFVEFDFNSFRAMVDTLGGVEVCVPPGGYYDPFSKLKISGGEHLITGNEALAFVRTRHGVGDGGDLGRIELQQEFIASLIQKLESQGTVDNPAELLEIANTATKALTVDPGLGSVSRLLSLAETLKDLHTRDVTFVTMPTIEDPANTNRLLPQQPEDDILWQMIQSDQEWTGSLAGTPASQVQVSVRNGTGVPDLAARTAASLRKLGFDVTSVGNAPPTSYTTVTYTDAAPAGSAWTLMNALTQAPAVQDGGTGPVHPDHRLGLRRRDCAPGSACSSPAERTWQACRLGSGQLPVRERSAGQQLERAVGRPDAQRGGEHLLRRPRRQSVPRHPALMCR